jgi:hypothetical protein
MACIPIGDLRCEDKNDTGERHGFEFIVLDINQFAMTADSFAVDNHRRRGEPRIVGFRESSKPEPD